MSFDLNITTVCNHKIFRELAVMGDDRRILRMVKPLSSSADIQVYASDNLVPRTMYDIIYDPESAQVNQSRMILFKNKWRSPKDFFEITYITFSNYCPKCLNLKVIDDTSYDVRGQMAQVRNEDLLLQNLEKWTVTEIKSNPFHGFVGTSLITLIGQRILDPDFLSTRITQEITSALQRFQDMQAQYQMTGRPMTDGETLESIENIEVKSNQDDPSILQVDVTVTARSGQPLKLTQYLRQRSA